MSPQVVERSAIVAFTPAQMFDLVHDVARYPEFLPWCVGAEAATVGESEQVATVKIARGVLRSQFTTRNRLRADAAIDMALLAGPFRVLTGAWRFEGIGPAEAPRGSRMTLRVEFEFNNGLMAAAFGSVFETVCSTMVDAFVARARKIYV